MKKEKKRIKKLNKKLLDKETRKKIKKIKCPKEFSEISRHTIISYFKNEILRIEKNIDKLEKEGKDVFFARTKLMMIPGKLQFFKINFCEKELNKLVHLFNQVERELTNHEIIQKSKKGRGRS